MMNTSGGDDVYLINTTLPNCLNSSFNLTRADDYFLTLYVNNTQGNIDSDSVNFSIELTGPAIELHSPLDNILLNNGVDIYFNFTPTNSTGSYSIDTCILYGDFNGTYLANYTWENPVNSTMNWTQVNLIDGSYNWNVWCNNTNNNGAWGYNRTFSVDTTPPTIDIGDVDTTQGSIIYFYPDFTEANTDTCWFSIYDSDGNIESGYDNITFTCDTYNLAWIRGGFGTYDLYVYIRDLAGHETSSTKSFTTSPSIISPGGGTTGDFPIEEEEPPKTFCGDGICQAMNDFGFRENFWTCPQDCQEGFDFDEWIYGFTWYCFDRTSETPCFWTVGLFSMFLPPVGNETVCGDNLCEINENLINCADDCGKFDMDTLFSNCFDDDIYSPCFWQQNMAFIVIFEIFVVIFILSLIKIKPPGERKKINTIQYIKLKLKKKKRR